MSGSGQEYLPDDRELLESLPNVLEWSGDPPGCPGVVGSLTGCLGVVERQFWMSGSGQEALLDVRE